MKILGNIRLLKPVWLQFWVQQLKNGLFLQEVVQSSTNMRLLKPTK